MRENDTVVFPRVNEVLDLLIAGVDESVPDLITGVHLTGSLALGDFRESGSDIDVMLIRADGASNDATMAALAPVLAELRRSHPTPALDGLVLDAGDLATGPDAMTGERPVVFDNEVRLAENGSGRNPVTWQTLRQCGTTYRGVPLDPDQLWHDPARLDAWTRGNLESYWRPWLGQAQRLAAHPDLAALIDAATEWGVLGVTRLHYTLATGEIVSKHGAGVYALDRFPACWHAIVEEALRIRERRVTASVIADPVERVRLVREYMAMVLEDALARTTRRTEKT